VGTRPAAWIDDGHNEACTEWAASREAPTLLVSTDPHEGLTDAQVDELIEWALEINARAE
jgi:anion-transporting  ArsA/GET3 family ATPase